ncbi:MAG TPA: isoprenyl transferase [Chloroflexia bacterium]|nr:isoprenyl transferase [Chloroflexia bacterium]
MFKFKQAKAVASPATPKTAELNELGLDPACVPQHVAIIMDGNGRWARERNLPRVAGHRAGAENIRRIVESSVRYGVKYLTLYAFSTENWRRPAEEVSALMTILGEVLDRETPKLHAEGVRINHLGRLDGMPANLRKGIIEATQLTRNNKRLVLNVCFNYGGRLEIVDAVRKIIASGIPVDEITEETISHNLYCSESPDPDLIIRTAGEQRLSNYLIWQAAYSEYWFTPMYWPDFGKDEYLHAIREYGQRLRKFGKTPEQIMGKA